MKTDEFQRKTEHTDPAPQPRHRDIYPHLPDGYRSGVITAITVLLGFSLLFLRSWVFELPGEWTALSLVAAVVLLLAIVMELVALWRALQPGDGEASVYQVTLRWVIAAATTLLLSMIIAGFAYAHVT